MPIPTALAPTAELATPRVKKFVEGLLKILGLSAKLDCFFLCEPGVNEVLGNGVGELWLEANWGAGIIANSFSLADLEAMRQKSKIIHVGDATVHPHDNSQVQIKLWLFARVMRW